MSSAANGPSKSEAEDGPSKRARLVRLGCINVPRRSLATLLREVKTDGVPDACSRSTIARARHDTATTKTIYGPLVRTITIEAGDSREWNVEVQSPFSMFCHLAAHSSAFSSLLQRTSDKYPNAPETPWGIILYTDGVSPTNPLRTGPDERAVDGVYWTVWEFDQAIHNEQAWFVTAALRTELVANLDGGMSNVVSAILRQLFFNDSSHHFATSGVRVVLKTSGATLVLFMRLKILIGDEKALKEVLFIKGSSGQRPCAICYNVYAHDHALQLAQDSERTVLSIKSLEVSKMRQETDERFQRQFTLLRNARDRLSASEFAKLEIKLGIKYSMHALLAECFLFFGVVSCVVYDWMHVWLVPRGIFAVEVGKFMRDVKRIAVAAGLPQLTYANIDAYLSKWTWPRSVASAGNLCTAKHAASHEKNEI